MLTSIIVSTYEASGRDSNPSYTLVGLELGLRGVSFGGFYWILTNSKITEEYEIENRVYYVAHHFREKLAGLTFIEKLPETQTNRL